MHDAWLIYGGDTGLLEVHNPGNQDFTVTTDQYVDPSLDIDGVLTQFTINHNANVTDCAYIINENGFLVGKDGLSIINNSPATHIVFQSNNEDSIILLGSISILIILQN